MGSQKMITPTTTMSIHTQLRTGARLGVKTLTSQGLRLLLAALCLLLGAVRATHQKVGEDLSQGRTARISGGSSSKRTRIYKFGGLLVKLLNQEPEGDWLCKSVNACVMCKLKA